MNPTTHLFFLCCTFLYTEYRQIPPALWLNATFANTPILRHMCLNSFPSNPVSALKNNPSIEISDIVSCKNTSNLYLTYPRKIYNGLEVLSTLFAFLLSYTICENVRTQFCYEEPVLWRTIKLKAYTIPLTTSLKLIKNVWNYLWQSTLADISTFCNW